MAANAKIKSQFPGPPASFDAAEDSVAVIEGGMVSVAVGEGLGVGVGSGVSEGGRGVKVAVAGGVTCSSSLSPG